jgi:hypothetical protein
LRPIFIGRRLTARLASLAEAEGQAETAVRLAIPATAIGVISMVVIAFAGRQTASTSWVA